MARLTKNSDIDDNDCDDEGDCDDNDEGDYDDDGDDDDEDGDGGTDRWHSSSIGERSRAQHNPRPDIKPVFCFKESQRV